MNRRRLLLRIVNGSRNVAFSDFVNLIEGLGFRLMDDTDEDPEGAS